MAQLQDPRFRGDDLGVAGMTSGTGMARGTTMTSGNGDDLGRAGTNNIFADQLLPFT